MGIKMRKTGAELSMKYTSIPANIYFFKVNNVIDIILVFWLLSLDIFHTFF